MFSCTIPVSAITSVTRKLYRQLMVFFFLVQRWNRRERDSKWKDKKTIITIIINLVWWFNLKNHLEI